MKIMSFNTQHCLNFKKRKIDLEIMAETIKNCQADVVGLNEDEQKNAVETVLANLKDEKCILMGDFNVTPENEVLKPIKERMKDTAVCFSSPLLSFPSDKPEIKIDYIFVSNDVEILNADIPSVVASDHRPHTAQVN